MAIYDPNKKEQEKRQAFQNEFQNWGQGYFGSDGPSSPFSLSGTEAEKRGAMSGLDLAKMGYGEGLQDVGKNIGEIRSKYKERIAGADPISAAIRNQKADAMASAQAQMQAQGAGGGAAVLAAQGIAKAKDAEVAQSLYGQQRQSLSDLRSLESNTLAGTMGIMQGEKGVATASNQPKMPESKGLMDSVICTELYRQGIMPLHIYAKDQAYGVALSHSNPEVIIGYHFWAKPLVKLMKKSKLFTKIVSYPAMKWAKQMAKEENSIVGYLAINVGQPLCGLLGKLIICVKGEGKYV